MLNRKRYIEEQHILVSFTDGTKIKIYDQGQQCCEQRYITTEETDFQYFIGSTFLGISESEAGYGSNHNPDLLSHHEIQFLRIETNLGSIDFVTHNEHNGYYGGFDIVIV